MKIYFLAHSGCAVELANQILVFDWWHDPCGHVKHLAQTTKKELYFFVTHNHGDHFEPAIAQYFGERAQAFILEQDCDALGFPTSKTKKYDVGAKFELDGMQIEVMGSTDAGGSFYIVHEEAKFYHAGDLNWWHWLGDTDENNEAMREFYFSELERLKNHPVDVAFFPVDARLEEAEEWGLYEFLHVMKPTKLLIPIHRNGRAWQPSYYYRWRFPEVPLHIFKKDGEFIEGV